MALGSMLRFTTRRTWISDSRVSELVNNGVEHNVKYTRQNRGISLPMAAIANGRGGCDVLLSEVTWHFLVVGLLGFPNGHIFIISFKVNTMARSSGWENEFHVNSNGHAKIIGVQVKRLLVSFYIQPNQNLSLFKPSCSTPRLLLFDQKQKIQFFFGCRSKRLVQRQSVSK